VRLDSTHPAWPVIASLSIDLPPPPTPTPTSPSLPALHRPASPVILSLQRSRHFLSPRASHSSPRQSVHSLSSAVHICVESCPCTVRSDSVHTVWRKCGLQSVQEREGDDFREDGRYDGDGGEGVASQRALR
jgi:hypothetical protein